MTRGYWWLLFLNCEFFLHIGKKSLVVRFANVSLDLFLLLFGFFLVDSFGDRLALCRNFSHRNQFSPVPKVGLIVGEEVVGLAIDVTF